MNQSSILVCPVCKAPIQSSGAEAWACPKCGRPFTLNQGVLSFLSPEQRFNEGTYEAKQISNWSYTANRRKKIKASRILTLLNSIRIALSMSGRRDRFFIRELKQRQRASLDILDLGCGGGRHYFCDYGRVVGIDPVVELLHIAREIYSEVYQCSGFDLPFAGNSFDYVVSSDVVGHIDDKNKDRLLKEIHRVLRPGGRTVHCSEALGANPWWTFAQKYPDLFREHFVDKPGHIGMELPSKIRERFLKHGFKEIRFRKLSSLIQEPGTLVAFFDNDFKTKSRAIAFFVAIDRLLSRSFVVKEMLNFLLEPISQLDDWLTPLDYGNGALIVYEKV